jgi:hypothetical protein
MLSATIHFAHPVSFMSAKQSSINALLFPPNEQVKRRTLAQQRGAVPLL